jgi:anaerobic selenocysteine-containing dehydrogenase
MTLRSEGQFNTVVYEDEDLYRGVDRRDALLMAAKDAARLGFAEGDKVRVESETGAMTATVFLVDIRPGNAAMYYPEANVLVPPKLDPRSKTPAFKHVAVRVWAWK